MRKQDKKVFVENKRNLDRWFLILILLFLTLEFMIKPVVLTTTSSMNSMEKEVLLNAFGQFILFVRWVFLIISCCYIIFKLLLVIGHDEV